MGIAVVNPSSKASLKLRIFAVSAAMMMMLPLLTGCWVRSVYPFYEESDVVVDQGLSGEWVGDGVLKTCALTIRFDANKRTYWLDVTNSNKGEAENRCVVGEDFQLQSRVFKGQLVQIGAIKCLDIVNLDEDGLDMLVRVDKEKSGLALTPLDSEWMWNAMDSKAVKLQGRIEVWGGEYGAGPPPNSRVTLVSPTSDLRDFLEKHGNDKGAFSETGRMTFQRK